MKNVCAAVALIAIAGCASHTGVISTGEGNFMIAQQQATGLPGLGNMKAEIIQEGSEYCAKMGKQFHLVTATETQPPYVLGNYPRSEISFTCVSKN